VRGTGRVSGKGEGLVEEYPPVPLTHPFSLESYLPLTLTLILILDL